MGPLGGENCSCTFAVLGYVQRQDDSSLKNKRVVVHSGRLSKLENGGIEPPTFRMQSGRSTPELVPQTFATALSTFIIFFDKKVTVCAATGNVQCTTELF